MSDSPRREQVKVLIGAFVATTAVLLLVGCGGRAEPSNSEHPTASQGADASRVGVRTITIASTGKETFSARVWYPTSGGGLQTVAANAIRPGYQAVVNGAVSLASAAPLVVLIHGTAASADAMAWIALDLVARGALVIGADHPASAGGDPNRRSILDVWTQPADVRVLLDQRGRTEWSARIDRDRMAVVGFSLGGASAMLLAGARLDFARFPEFCRTHNDGACDAFSRHFGTFDAAFLERANADHTEPRFRAAAAIAPGFTEAMTAESLRALTTPTLLITAERDQQVPPETHVSPMLGYLDPPSGHVQIRAAQHFSFMPPCRPNAVAILAETKEEFVCQEAAGRTRDEIHAEVLDAIVRFFRERRILAD
jgi:predicted dienelactone hydrolase